MRRSKMKALLRLPTRRVSQLRYLWLTVIPSINHAWPHGQESMDRSTYLSEESVSEFIIWLAQRAGELPIGLNVPRSGRVLRPIHMQLAGLEAVLETYQWKARWAVDAQGGESCDWHSTRLSLEALSERLRDAVYRSDADNSARDCLCAVFEWGGIRNPLVGAGGFVRKLPDARSYFAKTAQALALEAAIIDPKTLHLVSESQPLLMNAMLTKAHALLAEDGLPIYDSRVAASIATLVALYAKERRLRETPRLLKFPLTDRAARRGVPAVIVVDRQWHLSVHGLFARTQAWTSAKLRLGWITRAALEANSKLFGKGPIESRMRAFEAALFMTGYDTQAFVPGRASGD